jgi:peptidoglycan/xylan/chitin deacetylase (PgdA/CDA1 family)
MTGLTRRLHVIVYHYVRDFSRSRFPRLKGIHTSTFERQLDSLMKHFEMATADSALAFVNGAYQPGRDLCLLTFDDGLREHRTDVMPMLAQRGVQAVFAVTTSAADGRLAAVHKGHLLAATLDNADYRDAVVESAEALSPGTLGRIRESEATRLYRWDVAEVAVTKYLLNFALDRADRERIINDLFDVHLGDELPFARELYLSWDDVRDMQKAGMVIGGHSHEHVPLATLSGDAQRDELQSCAAALRTRLLPQPIWPFAYPYGSFDGTTCRLTREAGFDLAFTVEPGSCEVSDDVSCLRRFDANEVETILLGDAMSGEESRPCAV